MPLQQSSSHKLKGFFLELVRKSFGQLGVGDNETTDYVASVLTEFSRSDRWLQIRAADGRRLTGVVEMIMSQLDVVADESERVQGERMLRKYVGDYTLFMTGLFRRSVEHGGYLSYYLEEGARSYRAVSELDVSLYKPGFLMFEELSRGSNTTRAHSTSCANAILPRRPMRIRLAECSNGSKAGSAIGSPITDGSSSRTHYATVRVLRISTRPRAPT
jgi:hypothetical protein